jgi:hypothetical protein
VKTPVGCDQQRFRIVRAIRIRGMKHVRDLDGCAGAGGFGKTVDGNSIALRVVVADVSHIDARAGRAGADGYRFPILDPRTVDFQAPDAPACVVQRNEHGVPRIIVGPQTAWSAPTGGEPAAFRQLGDAYQRSGRLALHGRFRRGVGEGDEWCNKDECAKCTDSTVALREGQEHLQFLLPSTLAPAT